ncbi:MAG: inorganic diphosphatase [Myxococcales bacterium]|jgi:inorganic pyrophosphatase
MPRGLPHQTQFDNDTAVPPRCVVVVDASRMSFVKRHDDGRVDFVSPLPCPFNYGSVPGTLSGDGDRVDAVLLGPRVRSGSRLEVQVHGVARFVDAGEPDPKWICKVGELTRLDRLQVEAFFRVYAIAKRALNGLRGKSGATHYLGLARCDGGLSG